MKRTRKGFTLIELIVTIVILGILAALAVPAFQAVIEQSRKNAVAQGANSLAREAHALAAFDASTGGNVYDAIDSNDDDAVDDANFQADIDATGLTVTFDSTAESMTVADADGRSVVVDLSVTPGNHTAVSASDVGDATTA